MSLCCAQDESVAPAYHQSERVTDILDMTCYDCHDDTEQKGGVRLDNLDELDLNVRLNVLSKVQEQVHFKQMPPKKKDHPSEEDREVLLRWVSGELSKHGASKLGEKLEMYEYANHVDHDQLFSGEHAHLKGCTPDRRWLISEFIFKNKLATLLNEQRTAPIYGKRRGVVGLGMNSKVNVTNPFLLPARSGVRYYSNAGLGEEHLLTMVSNARVLSEYITQHLAKRSPGYLPAFTELMREEYARQGALARRKDFLEKFMEPLLLEIYGEAEHQKLLPEFKTSVSREYIDKVKKDPSLSASMPEKRFKPVLARTVRKHRDTSKTKEEIILKCEMDWFFAGYHEREIQSWASYLHGSWDGWNKHAEKYGLYRGSSMPEYKPLGSQEMEVITATIRENRKKGDTYFGLADKCMAVWEKELAEQSAASDQDLSKWLPALVEQCFRKVHERSPTPKEAEEYENLVHGFVADFGPMKGAQKLIQTLILRSEFVYREEFGASEADEHGRRMLSPRDASYAIAYALTDDSPDRELVQAAKSGRLATRADYEREVRRILKQRDQYYSIDPSLEDSFTNLPIRKLRFFREFFGYPNMLSVFKDNKRFGGPHDRVRKRLVIEADMLVEHILLKDSNVIESLLTTEEFYVFHSGDNKEMREGAERLSRIHQYFKDKPWENYSYEDLMLHQDFMKSAGMQGAPEEKDKAKRNRALTSFKRFMQSLNKRFAAGQKHTAPYPARNRLDKRMEEVQVANYFNLPLTEWDYPPVQPFKVDNRKGMLTHPAWLIAHSLNTENDPVRRGKWVRDKLLAGTVPDIPITVDAVIPENHHKTLRTRLDEATGSGSCWRCHVGMNPLGVTFEIYDDFGRYRKQESLEHPDNLVKKIKDKGQPYDDLRDIFKTLPVDARGELVGTGDANLDGEVGDALEMIDRLAKSDRVRQSVIRNAFRYFMGRNEQLSDSKTLIDADRAYLESGGSFDAVIISLLTSDSFIYRKPTTKSQQQTN